MSWDAGDNLTLNWIGFSLFLLMLAVTCSAVKVQTSEPLKVECRCDCAKGDP